jgi:NAD(P)-dependent dehydrogenase (short-subunit alcohol dehydrogenase family)/uncharacterized protein YndB with AHSA1/START domain
VQISSEAPLRGEAALITGGSRGIGLAIALTFARAGASVGLVARSAAELADAAHAIESLGGRVLARRADVVDESAMADVVDEVRATLGPITILVNNAGSIGPIGPFGEAPVDEWWRCVEVNLRGPVLCTQLVVQEMMAAGRGRIINLVSGAGTASFTYFSAYVASKTAVVRWSEAIGAELAPYGVRVFAMEPGTVVTGMSNFSVTSPEGRRWIPWFKGVFDAGLDSPMDRVAGRALDLAAGKGDALSGRYVPLTEDLSTLVAGEAEIRRDTLYSLRISRLAAATSASRAAAISAVRRQSEVASPSVVRLTRRLAVTAPEAFALWRDGDVLASWFFPPGEGEWLERPTMQPYAGGEFRLHVSARGDRYHIHGEVVDAVRDRSLSLRWNWESSSSILGSGQGTTVTIELVPVRDGVDVVITHEALPNEDVRDAYIRGWRRCLDGMDRQLQLTSANTAHSLPSPVKSR